MTSSRRTGWPVALLAVALLAALGGAGWAALVLAAGAAVWLLSAGRAAPAAPPRHARRPAAAAPRPIEEPMWGVWPAAAAGAVMLAGDRSAGDDDEIPGEDGAEDCDSVDDLGPAHAWHEPAPEVVDAEADGAGGWAGSGWQGGGGWAESWRGGGGWGSLPADAHDLDEVDAFDDGFTDGDW